MSIFSFQRVSSTAGLTFAAILVAFVCVMSAPSSATDGRTAVGMCIDSTASGARCAWSVNDKGEIDICNKNGCVYCPSAEGQCSVASRSRPRPTRGLPVGTKISTSVGTFEVTPRVVKGSFLKDAVKKPVATTDKR
jgi:hypothetical protein